MQLFEADISVKSPSEAPPSVAELQSEPQGESGNSDVEPKAPVGPQSPSANDSKVMIHRPDGASVEESPYSHGDEDRSL